MSEETERKILMVMRKVLGSVVRDTTPSPGMRHVLSERTIEEVRLAFELISARERELADAAGVARERPYFTDEEPAARTVPLDQLRRPGGDG